MYVPKIHHQEDQEEIYKYIKANGFATLVSQLDKRSIATHVPMYLNKTEEGGYTLLSHIALGNEQKKCLDGQQELLAIFMNSHTYVSSSWYNHINVPTWNYISIHVYGTAEVLEGEKLYSSINKLVDQYEGGREGRFHLSDMSDNMQKAHIKGLVGFEMTIDQIVPAFKLSQNRNDIDFHNVISKLEGEENAGSTEIAKEMKKSRS